MFSVQRPRNDSIKRDESERRLATSQDLEYLNLYKPTYVKYAIS